MSLWPDAIFCAFAFLCGSIPFSWLLGKMRGVDIRESGSGNTGATNLFRVCGKGPGLTGLFLDTMKGAVPVLIAKYGISGFMPHASEWALALASIMAVLGHVYSPWLGFKGGKGVATTLGVLLVLSPMTVAVGASVFLFVLTLSKYISLGSVSAAAVVIPSVFLFEPGNMPVQIIISLAAILILVRHRSNMVRLLHGEENRFSFHGDKK
jgi:acyl phosphate:glycerol-3-phosphate acyltransferase